MSIIVLLAAFALLTCGALANSAAGSARGSSSSRIIARRSGAVLLLLLAGSALFGTLASGEVSAPAERLPWQIGYTLVGVTAAGFALRLGFGVAQRNEK
jgi:hypothetical protein